MNWLFSVTGNTAVSPLHEWRIESHKFDRFVSYPLRRLQAQDNDHGKEFFVKLYIYNNAGHFLEVNTEIFRLPSRYPPGQAIVYDIDPDEDSFENTPKDTEIHFRINTLCVMWVGFRHHEHLDIEIGVGTDKIHDNIVRFYKTNNTGTECINSTALVTDRRYFVLVRARCSGGETLSSSNGVQISNFNKVLDSLRVKFGKNCYYEQSTYNFILKNLNPKKTVNVELPLHVGTTYSFIFGNKNGSLAKQMKIQSTNAYMKTVQNTVMDTIYSFVPLVEKPTFQFVINTLENVYRLNVSVVHCSCKENFIQSVDLVSIYWSFSAEYPKAFRYEIKITSVNSTSNNSFSSSPVSSFHSSNSENRLTLSNLQFDKHKSYQAAIKVCLPDRCLGTAYSEPIKLVTGFPHGMVQEAKVALNTTNNCLDIFATWKEFNDESGMLFYTWAVSKDELASRLLSEWRIMSGAGNKAFEVGMLYVI